MRAIVVAVCLLASAWTASAQNLTLEFRDGRVSIDATAVPVRTILSEWARLGGTKVVGGERVAGSPLTIHLENMPEAQALEIVLRNVAGYMAAPRRADSVGASAYDRILVMPTSSAPSAPTAAAARGTGATPGARAGRPFPPAQAPEPEPSPEPVQDTSDTGVNEPPFQFPQQNPFQGAAGQPGPFGTPMPPGAQPPIIQFGQGAAPGVSINPSPQQPMPVMQFPGMTPPTGATPTPGGFGIGSPTPGVIVQPAQPGQPVRPPGDGLQ
jgi:hypothetical protein